MLWFSQEKRFTLEAFGKLPIYQDFITVVSSPEAIAWKSWLLNNAGRETSRISEGIWPFIFNFSAKSNLLVGLVFDSSDGIREFPFSLFTVCKGFKGSRFLFEENLSGIWRILHSLWQDISEMEDINSCYKFLRGRNISLQCKKEKGKNSLNDVLLALSDDKDCPKLLVSTSVDEPRFHLLLDAQTEDRVCFEKWGKLRAVSAPSS